MVGNRHNRPRMLKENHCLSPGIDHEAALADGLRLGSRVAPVKAATNLPGIASQRPEEEVGAF